MQYVLQEIYCEGMNGYMQFGKDKGNIGYVLVSYP